MRWIFSVVIFLLVGISSVSAQDNIRLNDGTIFQVRVIEITPEVIRYKHLNNLDGPEFFIHLSEAHSIEYEDGSNISIRLLQREHLEVARQRAAIRNEQTRQAIIQREQERKEAVILREQEKKEAAILQEQRRQTAINEERVRQAAALQEREREILIQREQRIQVAYQKEQERKEAARLREQEKQATIQREQARQAIIQREKEVQMANQQTRNNGTDQEAPQKLKIGIYANAGGAIPLGDELIPGGPSVNVELIKNNFYSVINLSVPIEGDVGFGFSGLFNYLWKSKIGDFYLGGGLGYTYHTYHFFTFGASAGYRFVTSFDVFFSAGVYIGGRINEDFELDIKPILGAGYVF